MLCYEVYKLKFSCSASSTNRLKSKKKLSSKLTENYENREKRCNIYQISIYSA